MQLLTLPRRKRLTIDKQTIIIGVSKDKIIDYNKIELARGLLKSKKLKPTKIQRSLRSEWT